jgi:hypothetical protein
MDTIMREKESLLLFNCLKRDWQKEDYITTHNTYHNNTRIKEKHSMVKDGDLEIEGYQEK